MPRDTDLLHSGVLGRIREWEIAWGERHGATVDRVTGSSLFGVLLLGLLVLAVLVSLANLVLGRWFIALAMSGIAVSAALQLRERRRSARST